MATRDGGVARTLTFAKSGAAAAGSLIVRTKNPGATDHSSITAASIATAIVRGALSKFLPPTTIVPPNVSRAIHPSIAPAPSPRRSSSATPADSGVSDHPSPPYHSGRSIRYQRISFGRTPPSSTGYGSGQVYAAGAPWATRSTSARRGSATNHTGA